MESSPKALVLVKVDLGAGIVMGTMKNIGIPQPWEITVLCRHLWLLSK
jgi:hypothetical protein